MISRVVIKNFKSMLILPSTDSPLGAVFAAGSPVSTCGLGRHRGLKGTFLMMDFPNQWDGLGYGNNMIFPFEVEVCAG